VILNSQAVALFEAGDLKMAEIVGERAVAAKMADRGFGPNSPQLAGAQYELARIYFEQKKYPQAETLLKQAVQINETELGPLDPSVTLCLQAYSRLLRQMKRNEEAAAMEDRIFALQTQRRADLLARELKAAQEELVRREQELGPDAPAIEPSVRKLAMAWTRQSNYLEAGPLFERSLNIREKALGPDHPDVGDALSDLAEANYALKKYPEAEVAWQRSLTILEKAVGADHHRLLKPLRGYARLLQQMGRHDEANAMNARIRIIEKKYPLPMTNTGAQQRAP
jgi:tetratricopeptide (TPR) repeat protein